MRRRLLALLVISSIGSTALACSCEPDETDTTTPGEGEGERIHGLSEGERTRALAKVGERTITLGEFADAIATKGPFLRARYASPERRRELLDQMIRFELLAQEADREGYDELDEVQRTHKQILIRRFLKQRYEDAITPESISDEDVSAYYESHEEEFHKPEQVRASHILFRDRATAARVLRQILASPSDMRLFRALAEEHNADEATSDRFGDLRFFSRPAERQSDEPDVPAAVAEAAFSITTVGGVHGEVVESDMGFHIVKLTGRRAAMHRSLEESSRPIRHRLLRERRERGVEELVERLRAESDVREDLSLLSQVQFEVPTGSHPTEQALPTPGTPMLPIAVPPGAHPPGPDPTAPTPRPAPTAPTPRPAPPAPGGH